jgi:hypothetical protein
MIPPVIQRFSSANTISQVLRQNKQECGANRTLYQKWQKVLQFGLYTKNGIKSLAACAATAVAALDSVVAAGAFLQSGGIISLLF